MVLPRMFRTPSSAAEAFGGFGWLLNAWFRANGVFAALLFDLQLWAAATCCNGVISWIVKGQERRGLNNFCSPGDST